MLNSELRFCHLAWHFDLRDHIIPAGYLCDACRAYDDPITTDIIIAQIVKVRTHKDILAYSFGNEGDVFGPSGEVLGLDTAGTGLTCATFVIAFFASIGIEICLGSTWLARSDDRDWQRNMMKHVSEDPKATCEHIWGMRRYIGAIRFRPDEVAICATHSNPPLDFETAKALAAELQQMLQ